MNVMYKRLIGLAVFGGAMGAISPAIAQETAAGPYVVGRIGSQLDGDLKFKGKDVASPSTLPRNVDLRNGKAFEGGLGYDFGNFRVEGLVGYTAANVDASGLNTGGLVTRGRTKTLSIGVAGYYDIDTGTRLRPFVGGGIDAVRVAERLSRVSATGQGSSLNGRDWGFRWHLDAGVGYALTNKTTVEIAGRYGESSGLRFNGRLPTAAGGSAATSYRPTLSATSITVGLRQRF